MTSSLLTYNSIVVSADIFLSQQLNLPQINVNIIVASKKIVNIISYSIEQLERIILFRLELCPLIVACLTWEAQDISSTSNMTA